MKTRKKLLIALLSATCLTAGAFGFAACDKKTETNDKALVGIYNAYKEEAAANNQTVLTYEEWLKAKLEAVAQPGEQGDPGADGKSAYEIAKENGFTGTEEEWLESLVGAAGTPGAPGDQGDPGTPGANGVGVKSVAMSADGKSLIVTLTNDQTVTVALPKNITHSHSYAGEFHELIAAEDGKEGLAYQVCKANGCDHIELFAFNAPASGEGTASEPYVLNADLSNVGNSQSFKLKPASRATYGYNLNRDVYVTFKVDKTGKYTLKDTAGVGFTLVEGGTVDADGAMCLYGGQDVTVAVNTDDTVYPEIIVSLTFEETLTAGNSKGFPLALGAEEVTLSSANADKDGYIYLKMTGAKGNYKFTSDDADIEVVLTRYEYNPATWKYDKEVEDEIELGEVIENVGVSEWPMSSDAVLLKVKLSDGTKSAKFKATAYFEAGEDMSTAFTLTHDTEITAVADYVPVWYKYVATASGIKTFASNYEDASYIIYDADGKLIVYASGAVYPFYFEEGTYYIKAEMYGNTFKVRDYVKETDEGLSKYAALEIKLDTATSNENRYFQFTAEEQATYVIISSSNYTVYSDVAFSQKTEITDNAIELEENGTFYIDTFKVPVTVKKLSDVENEQVDYVITVTDNNREAIAGVKVTVNGVEATTGVDGKVTITTIPGKYEINLDFGEDADKYGYTTVTTPKAYTDEVNVSVFVNVEKTYTVTVKGSGEAKSGVEVSIWKVVTGNRGEETETQYEKVGETKTTDDNGQVTFVLLSGVSYEVRLDKVPEGFSYPKNVTIGSNQTVTVNLTADKPVDPDEPDEPAEKYTYLYKGWEQFVDGEQKFYLETSYAECAYELKVEGGYIKYLKTIVEDWWGGVAEDEWIVDGVYTDMAEGWLDYPAGETATEIIDQYGSIFTEAQIELVICSYDGMETKVVFNKIPSNSDY